MLSRKDGGCGCTDTDTDIRLPQIPVLMPTLGDGQGRTSSALNCSAGLLVCLALLICSSATRLAAVQPRALSTANRQPPIHPTTQPRSRSAPTNTPSGAPLFTRLTSTSGSHTSFKSVEKQSYSHLTRSRRPCQQQRHPSHRPSFALPMLLAASSEPVSSRRSQETHRPLPRSRPRLSISLYQPSRFQQASSRLPEPIAILAPVVTTIPPCFFAGSAREVRHHAHSLTRGSL